MSRDQMTTRSEQRAITRNIMNRRSTKLTLDTVYADIELIIEYEIPKLR